MPSRRAFLKFRIFSQLPWRGGAQRVLSDKDPEARSRERNQIRKSARLLAPSSRKSWLTGLSYLVSTTGALSNL